MHDAGVVARLHRLGNLMHQLRRLPRRQRRAVQVIRQAAAFAELHREERQPLVLADLVDAHHPRVTQPADRLRLAAEPLLLRRPGVRPRQDHLQRHHAVDPILARLVHDAHAAARQLLQDLVAGHPRPRRRRPLPVGERVVLPRGTRRRGGAERVHDARDALLRGEELPQPARQVRVTAQQLLAPRRPAGRLRLQVRRQHFVQLLAQIVHGPAPPGLCRSASSPRRSSPATAAVVRPISRATSRTVIPRR